MSATFPNKSAVQLELVLRSPEPVLRSLEVIHIRLSRFCISPELVLRARRLK